MRFIAIDWSGAKEPLTNLWLAEAANGQLIDVRPFPTRRAAIEHVIGLRTADPELVVGLDFAFSLPAWFFEERGLRSVHELWDHMSDRGDEWLEPRSPFWSSKGGAPKQEQFRTTELELKAMGLHPTSVFKLVGASQVGRGSVRGMACLRRLREAGFAIWPFDSGLPSVVEIYPAALADIKGKSQPGIIAGAVKRDDRVPAEWKAHAACSQDAFDAAMSAVAMSEHAHELRDLAPASSGNVYALEGRIWLPDG